MSAPVTHAAPATVSSRCLCLGPRHADGCRVDGSLVGPPARPAYSAGRWRMAPAPAPGPAPCLPPAGCLWLIDTETTGLPPDDPSDPRAEWPRIVEVAAVPLYLSGPRAGTLGAARSSLVRPDVPVPERAAAIHGLDDAALSDAPPWEVVWPRVVQALPAGAWVAAHNAPFDRAVLRAEVLRVGAPLPGAWRWWCSLEMAHWAMPGLASYALGHLRAALGLGAERAHRAAADARTAARLVAHLHPGRPVAEWAGAWGDGVQGWSAPMAGDVEPIHRSHTGRRGEQSAARAGDDR